MLPRLPPSPRSLVAAAPAEVGAAVASDDSFPAVTPEASAAALKENIYPDAYNDEDPSLQNSEGESTDKELVSNSTGENQHPGQRVNISSHPGKNNRDDSSSLFYTDSWSDATMSGPKRYGSATSPSLHERRFSGNSGKKSFGNKRKPPRMWRPVDGRPSPNARRKTTVRRTRNGSRQ